MKKQTHPIYKEYPNQPYISEERNLDDWEQFPEKYPYGIVAKQQMIKLEEDIFPGDIVMLWRINFNNITTETIMPNYFEYRYGISSEESLERLIMHKYCYKGTAYESLDLLSIPILKRILKNHKLSQTGKKNDLLNRIKATLTEAQIAEEFLLRRYIITNEGKIILNKYKQIIEKHGPKM